MFRGTAACVLLYAFATASIVMLVSRDWCSGISGAGLGQSFSRPKL